MSEKENVCANTEKNCDIENRNVVFTKLVESSNETEKATAEVEAIFAEKPVTQDSIGEQLADFNREAIRNSEYVYNKLVSEIINLSKTNLSELRTDKRSLREFFESFFVRIVSAQFMILILLLFLNATHTEFNISDTVLVSFMSSVFVQTLGGIVIMITFAFKSDEEVKIIDILNTFIQTYQKYKDNK